MSEPVTCELSDSVRKRRFVRMWPWACAVGSGLMLALCYPGFGFGGLCWLALVPLICAVWFSRPAARRERLRIAGLGFAFGLAFFAVSSFWLATLTVPGCGMLVVYFAFYPAVWTLFLRRVAGQNHNWLSSLQNLCVCAMAAAGWVALEWLRGVVFPAFGWNGLGIALYKNIPLIQIADVTGVGGISFLVAMVNLMVVATVKRLVLEVGRGARRPHYDFGLTVALVALVWGYGVRQMLAPAPESRGLSFAAVQANVPQATRNNPAFEEQVLGLYKKHTATAAAMNPDLILWPESATPSPLFNDQRTWDEVRKLAEGTRADFLLGTVYLGDQGDYNSVVLLTDRAKGAQMYHKMHLVPFGEYVPLRQAFPLFAWVVGDLVPDDFDPGAYPVVLELSAFPAKLGPLVCFEDTVGELARQFALRGAQAFVVVTNDGWFLRSAGSKQHLANAIFRCAENKIPMLRAANTGVTCVVDRFGAVRQVLQSEGDDTFIEGVLFGSLPIAKAEPPTFYARNGEVFSLACLAVSAAACAVFLMRAVKFKKSSCPESPEKKISMP